MFKDLPTAIEAVNSGEAILLDVRTLKEHKDQAAHKAVHLDVLDIQKGHDPELEKDTVILIHCRSGGRAGTAHTILEARGYSNVQNVGGLIHWLDAGGKAKD